MYINTVAFYAGSLTLAGNPAPYSITPFLARPYTDSMSLLQRTINYLWFAMCYTVHVVTTSAGVQPILRRHFGNEIPHTYDITRNVSVILQNGHHTVTYNRPFLPNVAEIACIHCKPAKPLPKVI